MNGRSIGSPGYLSLMQIESGFTDSPTVVKQRCVYPQSLERYACSICSADFNEWIVKNATFDSRYSYMFKGGRI